MLEETKGQAFVPYTGRGWRRSVCARGWWGGRVRNQWNTNRHSGPARVNPYAGWYQSSVLGACLQNHVERGFRRSAHMFKPTRHDHFTQPCFPCLCSKRGANLLREGGGHAHQDGGSVGNPTQRIEIVLQLVACKWL